MTADRVEHDGLTLVTLTSKRVGHIGSGASAAGGWIVGGGLVSSEIEGAFRRARGDEWDIGHIAAVLSSWREARESPVTLSEARAVLAGIESAAAATYFDAGDRARCAYAARLLREHIEGATAAAQVEA